MKARTSSTDYSKMDQREHAFGMLKGAKKSEDYLHMKTCRFLKETYPMVRFYSTLDGFNLGNQRSLISSIQCLDYPGVSDLFVFYPNKQYSMLILELKKEGENIYKRDGKTFCSDHIAKQADWLKYFRDTCNADAKFSVGYTQTIKFIIDYLKNSDYEKQNKKRRESKTILFKD